MNGQTSHQQPKDGRHDDDAALTEFLASLMDYTPTVIVAFCISPCYNWNLVTVLFVSNYVSTQILDELVEHYLAKSGFQCPDTRL